MPGGTGGRGAGRGQGGGPGGRCRRAGGGPGGSGAGQGAGMTDVCVCPACGAKAPHERGYSLPSGELSPVRQTHGAGDEPEASDVIISVASGKGGTGKTTIATNLAVALEDAGAVPGLRRGRAQRPSLSQAHHSVRAWNFMWRCRKLIRPDARFAASARKFASSTPSPSCPTRRSPFRNCAIAAAAAFWSVRSRP